MQNVIDLGGLQRIVFSCRAPWVDFAEVFAELGTSADIEFDNGKVERTTAGTEAGVGVRLVRGATVAYSIVNSPDPDRILAAALQAAEALRLLPDQGVVVLPATGGPGGASDARAVRDLGVDEFARSLSLVDRAARSFDQAVTHVALQGRTQERSILVLNSDGLCASDHQAYTRVYISVVTTRGGKREANYYLPARATGAERFFHLHPPADIAQKAAHMALIQHEARPAPTGPMSVVVGSGRGGVLIHEACVHPLEADFISRSNSVYRGLLGQPIASDTVTVVDDATAPGDFPGNYRIDDEGCAGCRNVLVEKGVLRSYLTDAASAAHLGQRRTGSGRRQSYQYLPMPRMSNTYIERGEWEPSEIIRATSRGIYAKEVGGGEVNQVTGEFVFSIAEGYLIEDGRVTAPIQGATLVGFGPEVLHQIDMVGSDLTLAAALCEKNGQVVPVGVGQPTLRIREMVVGGTSRQG